MLCPMLRHSPSRCTEAAFVDPWWQGPGERLRRCVYSNYQCSMLATSYECALPPPNIGVGGLPFMCLLGHGRAGTSHHGRRLMSCCVCEQ